MSLHLSLHNIMDHIMNHIMDHIMNHIAINTKMVSLHEQDKKNKYLHPNNGKISRHHIIMLLIKESETYVDGLLFNGMYHK